MANDAFNWDIIGEDALAEALRAASPYVPTPRELTVSTDPSTMPDGAIGTGSGLLGASAETVVSSLIGFRALEHIYFSVANGDVRNVYGLFGASRLPRSSAPAAIDQALADLLAYAFEVFHSPVKHGHARRASLVAENDAWFVTLRLASGVVLTLEVLATSSTGAGEDIVVEVTGSERVLRAEPMRQSVRLLPVGGEPHRLPWMEDQAERSLQFIAGREPEVRSGERLRDAWELIQESSRSASAITP